MAERGTSHLADKINAIRISRKGRRTSAPDILRKGSSDTKAPSTSLSSSANAAPLRRSATTDPTAERKGKTKREQRTSLMVQRMDPNDIIKMLEMQARNADSEIGLESLQALKNTSGVPKERRSSRKKIERSMSTDGSTPGGETRKPRRSSKKNMVPRCKSHNPVHDKSWAGLSVDDL